MTEKSQSAAYGQGQSPAPTHGQSTAFRPVHRQAQQHYSATISTTFVQV